MPADHRPTVPLQESDPSIVQRFRVSLVGAPAAVERDSSGGRLSAGSHRSNDLVLDDPTVSRFHCEIRFEKAGPVVRDLDSRNGTWVDGVRVREAFLRGGSTLRLGKATLRFELTADRVPLDPSPRTSLGELVGSSVPMRLAFAALERSAASESTVLIKGESGTGKEAAARAVHGGSPRRDGPYVVVDCGALPETLLESELFGHEKGAFTGATARRIGAFEEASGGTVFLDEIGELPLELQPKLLRVLEGREIRRLGSNAMQKVDVRVVAATHRDLRTLVNQGQFRHDLYFRLAVVRVELPPLRTRLDDLPLLVDKLLGRLGAPQDSALRAPGFLATLARGAWPGNVRELRNHLERCLVFQRPLPPETEGREPAAASPAVATPAAPADQTGRYADVRRRALDEFEKAYLRAMLEKHGGKVAPAAVAGEVDRVYFYELMRKHGIGRDKP